MNKKTRIEIYRHYSALAVLTSDDTWNMKYHIWDLDEGMASREMEQFLLDLITYLDPKLENEEEEPYENN